MFDGFSLPPLGNVLDRQFFVGAARTATSITYKPYQIPTGSSFLYIWGCGGGGGGGGGVSGATSLGGGGGGGGGSRFTLLVPTLFLPPVIYLDPGAGGAGSAGGASPVAGASGEPTRIWFQPYIDGTLIRWDLANGGGGGGGGLTSGQATAGAAGGNPVTRSMSVLSLFNTIVGNAGGAGCNAAAGQEGNSNSTTNINTAPFALGGAGGGGIDASGIPIAGAPANAATDSNGAMVILPTFGGDAGFTVWNNLFRNIGGAGGQGGSKGGDGGLGCGGGGGCGYSTGGDGGDGGPGFIAVWAF